MQNLHGGTQQTTVIIQSSLQDRSDPSHDEISMETITSSISVGPSQMVGKGNVDEVTGHVPGVLELEHGSSVRVTVRTDTVIGYDGGVLVRQTRKRKKKKRSEKL